MPATRSTSLLSPSPLDILLVQAGQSNNAGWTVKSGNREYTTADTPDDRIRIFDTGKGSELVSNGDFSADASGWTLTGCTADVSSGRLALTATSGSNPRMSQTLTGLTIGKTYEVTCDVEPVTVNCLLRFSGLSEALGTRYSDSNYTAAGVTVAIRARFTATATSHDVLFSSNSGSTPTGSVFAYVKNISCKEVLSSGISYPKAVSPLGGEVDFANIAAMGLDPTFVMAKRLLARGVARRVTILPVAIGGTALVSGEWTYSTGSCYTDTVTKLTAALADNPDFVPILTWVQGEADATAARTVDQYTSAFKAMIDGLRAISGAAKMRCVIGQMVPEYVSSTVPLGSSTSHRRIDVAHRLLPNLLRGVHFVASPLGGQKAGEAYHYSALGARQLGTAMGDVPNFDWSR